MKKLLFLGACLVALASQPVMAQTDGPEVIVVQTYQSRLNLGRMIIDRGLDKPEIAEFKLNPQEEQATAFQKLFAKLALQGYVLKSTFSIESGVTTLVFGKR